MTSSGDQNDDEAAAFGLITADWRVLDLSPVLNDEVAQGVTWSSPPSGPILGLKATKEGHTVTVAWASPEEALHEARSANAPEELAALVRRTYVMYIETCLQLGEFQLEFTPITSEQRPTTGPSLRDRLIERGAIWLAAIPLADHRRFPRLPSRSELTVIEPPSSQPSSATADEPGVD